MQLRPRRSTPRAPHNHHQQPVSETGEPIDVDAATPNQDSKHGGSPSATTAATTPQLLPASRPLDSSASSSVSVPPTKRRRNNVPWAASSSTSTPSSSSSFAVSSPNDARSKAKTEGTEATAPMASGNDAKSAPTTNEKSGSGVHSHNGRQEPGQVQREKTGQSQTQQPGNASVCGESPDLPLFFSRRSAPPSHIGAGATNQLMGDSELGLIDLTKEDDQLLNKDIFSSSFTLFGKGTTETDSDSGDEILRTSLLGTTPTEKTSVLEIVNFSKINQVMYGDVVESGELKWKLVFYPSGKEEDSAGYVSIFLRAEGSLGNSCTVSTHIIVSVVNPSDASVCEKRTIEHVFCAEALECGFATFLSRDCMDKYLHADKVKIIATLEVCRTKNSSAYSVLDDDTIPPWDSRQSTGYVGIMNQGATCYLNSLLQVLFHIMAFRHAVFQIPTDNSGNSISFALQKLFYDLQYSANAVSTNELTTSFGWDPSESYRQHDVQELYRIMCDKLEEKMKGTPAEAAISTLFSGKLTNYVRCTRVDYQSAHEEIFYDISLVVEGFQDIRASFARYISEEQLTGANQYFSPQYGLQDAITGVIFNSLPPVLNLQLKRFSCDSISGHQTKVNSRFEYPQTLDLDAVLGPKLVATQMPANGIKEPNIYELHAVFVHSGDTHGGHYYVYIRPRNDNQWYKMNDSVVTLATEDDALAKNYGGEDTSYNLYHRGTSAYLLVYIRTSEVDKVLCPWNPSIIPASFKEVLDSRKMYPKESTKEHHGFVQVATEDDFRNNQGYGLVLSWSNVTEFEVRKGTSIDAFKEYLVSTLHLSSPIMLRSWQKRLNDTLRVGDPLDLLEAKVFIETCEATPLENSVPQSLIFLKYFDYKKQSLRYVGKVSVPRKDKLRKYLPLMCELVGLPAHTRLLLNEEVKPGDFEPIPPISTFKAADLDTGDIIIFQIFPQETSFPSLATYFANFYNRVSVLFCPSELVAKNPRVSLQLSNTDTLSNVIKKLASVLKADPKKVTINKLSMDTDKSLAHVLGSVGGSPLSKLTLDYEILEIPYDQLELHKAIHVSYYDLTTSLVKKEKFYVPLPETINYIVGKVKQSHGLPQENSEFIFSEQSSFLITKEYDLSSPVYVLSEKKAYRVDLRHPLDVPGVASTRVQVVHYDGKSFADKPNLFGVPFFICFEKDSSLAHLKSLIAQRLNIPPSQMAGWEVGIISKDRRLTETLEDDEEPVVIEDGVILGLGHTDPEKAKSKWPKGSNALKIPGLF